MEDDSSATEIHEESTCPLLDEQFPRGKGPGLCSVRWGLALILHISLFVTYSQRVDLSIAIVAMVNSTGQQKSFNVSADVCPGPSPAPLNTSQPREVKAPVYDWTPETCGLLLSSFSYGYLVTQVPGGYLTGIVGWKPVLGIGLLLSSVLGLLLPSAAELGVIYLALVQAFRGLSQGVIFPAVYTLWTKWAPPQELTCLMNVADADLGDNQLWSNPFTNDIAKAQYYSSLGQRLDLQCHGHKGLPDEETSSASTDEEPEACSELVS